MHTAAWITCTIQLLGSHMCHAHSHRPGGGFCWCPVDRNFGPFLNARSLTPPPWRWGGWDHGNESSACA
eukprot:scaffold81305_cov25-Tisochrysis_lutea.AAC.3